MLPSPTICPWIDSNLCPLNLQMSLENITNHQLRRINLAALVTVMPATLYAADEAAGHYPTLI